MRTLDFLFNRETLRLCALALATCLLFFAQAFTRPEVPVSRPATHLVADAPSAVTVTAGSNGPLCVGYPLNLTSTPSGGTAPYTYSWNGPAGFTSTAQNPTMPNVTTAQAGTYTVTVTESGGMTGTATVVVEVQAPPTANAGPDKILCKGASLQLNGMIGGTATSAVWLASPAGGIFTPNPLALNAVYHPPANFTGKVTLTLTTNNPLGPCDAASDQLVVTYGQPDALVCNDLVEISLDEDCSVTVTPDMALEGDVLDELHSVSIFTLQGVNIGNTITSQYVGVPLKIKVSDNCSGNFCITDVKVQDVLPPVFVTCESFDVPCVVTDYSPDYLFYTLGIKAAHPQVTDNCSNYTLTKNDTWVDVPCGGSFHGFNDLSGYVKRIWQATDASGNKSTCTQYIYFKRINIADLKLPGDVTVSCEVMATNPMATGTPTYSAFGQNFPLHGNNTFCDISATTQDQIIPFCGGTYTIIRKWTIYDLCSPSSPNNPMNPLTYVQLINVIDQTGPAIACPKNLTVSTDPLACCATADLPDVIVGDACGTVKEVTAQIFVIHPFTGDTIDHIFIAGSLATFPNNNLQSSDTLGVFGFTPCLPVGKHIVNYLSEDGCGNTSVCSFYLTVADLVPPVAACDEITQVSLGIDGMIFVNASTFDDGSYDNCGITSFKVRRQDDNDCQPNNKFFDQAKLCCEDVGDTVIIILRVYDVPVPPGEVSLSFEEEHSNDCQVQVYVDDKLKPACLPPANVTVNCESFDPSLWAYGTANAVDNCCLDTIIVSTNYNLFDTVCSKGTIVRTFRAFDCSGLSNQCTQRITVEYKQDYYIRFPDDAVVTTCGGLDIFGEPKFFGEDCELLGVSYEDQIFTVVPDACFKIERTWTIINWCTYDPNMGCTLVPNPNPSNTLNHPSNLAGPTVSPFGTPSPWAPTVTKINPGDATATNYSSFWSPNPNCYKYKQIIKITDTQAPTLQCPGGIQEQCDLTDNDPQLWHESYWIDNKYQSHDLCEGPADLCVTGTDACSGANVHIRYLLFLDLNNDGSMETVVNSLNPPPPNVVYYGNSTTPNYSGGTARAFDERSVPLDQKYQFAIQFATSGNNKTACLRWNTQANPGNYVIPQLPHGKHKIKWIIEDGCGNESVCEYLFVVKDCKAPTVKCYNGLSTNMMPTGQVMLEYSLFLEEAQDNCTPTNMLVFGIRKSGTGTDFPYLPNGMPQTTVTFDCSELGFQLVEIWAMDMSGNADYCTTFIHVQDNAGICGSNTTIAGALANEQGDGLEEGHVEIKCNAPTGQPPISLFDMTDVEGKYEFNKAIPIQCNYVLTPAKDNDPLNGVSTYDLVLINKHILGLAPLGSPYKMIAADANGSRSVTTVDVVELRKLILGIYSELPANTSWRFVDKAYQFPNPDNPFQEMFPESKWVWNVQQSSVDDDFVAIKVGDVNSSSQVNSHALTDDRSEGTLLFDIRASGENLLKAGDVFTARFTAAEKVQGFQFTANFPGLEVLSIQPGEGLSEANFAVFPQDQAFTTSAEVPAAVENATFDVTFRAVSTGLFDRMLGVSSRITRAEAYPDADDATAPGVKKDIAFRFENGGTPTVSALGFELYQNSPNPWVQKTQIGFHLPEAARATLTIRDDLGRSLFARTDQYKKGYNAVLIDRALLDVPGLLYYTLETPHGMATKKMIQSR